MGLPVVVPYWPRAWRHSASAWAQVEVSRTGSSCAIRARLVSIGRSYEEAAADLGASWLAAIRRVLVPMLMPAIFASAVLVFASTVDDFVIVQQLSSTANTQPMSVLIYANVHGGLSGPALNALATIMLLVSLLAALIGFIGYRWMTRGERTKGSAQALTAVAGI